VATDSTKEENPRTRHFNLFDSENFRTGTSIGFFVANAEKKWSVQIVCY
jgi:hypothetical protein